jgi:cytochrome c oxidase assembly protein subunit 15
MRGIDLPVRPRVASLAVRDTRFSRFAWFVLAYNVGVILLGAVVRATESGAGCGSNWPTCRGSLIPSGGTVETAIEFAHRATSGIALALVATLAVWAIRTRPRGDIARWMALASGVLIFNEALIGAALVLFEWVADDESIGRVISIVVHLVNTFLLLGSLTLTAWFGGGRPPPRRPLAAAPLRTARIGVIALLVVGAAGAITALGDTLFPPDSVGSEFLNDLRGTFIVRLRWIHPILAVATAGYLWRVSRTTESAAGLWLHSLVYTQVIAGIINIAALAPTWMQVIHLLLADALWISFVLVATQSLVDAERVPA